MPEMSERGQKMNLAKYEVCSIYIRSTSSMMWLQTRRDRVGSEVGKSCPIFFLLKTPKFFRDDLSKVSSSMAE